MSADIEADFGLLVTSKADLTGIEISLPSSRKTIFPIISLVPVLLPAGKSNLIEPSEEITFSLSNSSTSLINALIGFKSSDFLPNTILPVKLVPV